MATPTDARFKTTSFLWYQQRQSKRNVGLLSSDEEAATDASMYMLSCNFLRTNTTKSKLPQLVIEARAFELLLPFQEQTIGANW